jgi:phage-related protein
MPKTLPAAVHQDAIDPYSGGAWMHLLEIVVPTQNTQRIARNTEDVVYAGDRFTKFNFDVSEQVFSSDGSVPRVTVRIAQDRAKVVEKIINDTYGALNGTVKIIKAGEKFLDVAIPALEFDYDILGTESDDAWVTLTLGIPNPLSAAVPKRSYSSSSCPFATPSLFKGPECAYAGMDLTCTGTYQDCYGKSNAARWGGDLGLDPNGLTL